MIEEQLPISQAIKRLTLKLTTARLILQKYKETGAFPMRKFKKCSRMMQDFAENS